MDGISQGMHRSRCPITRTSAVSGLPGSNIAPPSRNALQGDAWAHANRAWMIVCQLAAARRRAKGAKGSPP